MSWGAKKTYWGLRARVPLLLPFIRRYESWGWNRAGNVKDRDEVIWAQMTRVEAYWWRKRYWNSTKLYNITKGG